MGKLITKDVRKTFTIRPSGRSTDFISPSFGYGCLYNCSYCYMKRHKDKGLSIAVNTGDILTEINNHAYFTPVDKPNQTHAEYTTYDISCNEDFALHAKYHDWQRIFEFFRDHPVAMGSFATKFVNPELINFDPKGKIRIRFSLMPQHKSDLHEPGTSKIIDRIKAIDAFIEAGYDVHVNYSIYSRYTVMPHQYTNKQVQSYLSLGTRTVQLHISQTTASRVMEETQLCSAAGLLGRRDNDDL